MANEATVFSLTTTEMATGAASQAGGDDVDVSTENAAAMTASVDIGLYFLKAAYEGNNGRNKLILHLDKIRAKLVESAWPAI